jgi:hypothetical protein
VGWYQKITTRAGEGDYVPFDFNTPVDEPVMLVASFRCGTGFANIGISDFTPRCCAESCPDGYYVADCKCKPISGGSGGSGGISNVKVQNSLAKVIDSIAKVEAGGGEMLNAGALAISRISETPDVDTGHLTDIINAVNDMATSVSRLECATKEKLCCSLEHLCNCAGLDSGDSEDNTDDNTDEPSPNEPAPPDNPDNPEEPEEP